MKTARQIGRDAKELRRLCLANGALDDGRVRLVAGRLVDSQRAEALATLRQFLRLVKLDEARRTARIESAAPLDADVQAAVTDSLVRRYGRALTTTFVVDPSLIGGMRLTIGSDVYDGSIKGGLAALDAGW